MADRRPLLLDALVALYPEAGLKAGATGGGIQVENVDRMVVSGRAGPGDPGS